MFEPPCCPNSSCPMRVSPVRCFWQRNGHYSTRCKPRPIQRFRCKACGKRFSTQTFRIDYHDKKPHLNAEVFERLNSGTGLRRIGLALGCSRATVERKFHKLARHMRWLNENVKGDFRAGTIDLAFDELETFETCRRVRPLTVPVVVEVTSYFIVDAISDTLPARGRLKGKDRQRMTNDWLRFGRRRNRSSRVVFRVLQNAARICPEGASLVIRSDLKRTYPGLIAKAFGRGRPIEHRRISSRARRTTCNPLFAANHTETMLRDLMGRLHRQSWLHTKERRWLDGHLALAIVYRNYVRPWRNGEADSPAVKLGFTHDTMTVHQAVSWRQDFGPFSVHPLGRRCESVASYRRAMRRLRDLAA